MKMHARFLVHGDPTRAGFRKRGDEFVGILNHQVAIEDGVGRAFRKEATTSGPIVRFGTKWPSITSQWITVPPPSSAALASSASRAKFADSIEGASSMVMGSGPLLPFPQGKEIIRGSSSMLAKSMMQS